MQSETNTTPESVADADSVAAIIASEPLPECTPQPAKRIMDIFAGMAANIRHNYEFEVGDYAWQSVYKLDSGKLVRIVTRIEITEVTQVATVGIHALRVPAP